jgi:hypothetical protein
VWWRVRSLARGDGCRMLTQLWASPCLPRLPLTRRLHTQSPCYRQRHAGQLPTHARCVDTQRRPSKAMLHAAAAARTEDCGAAAKQQHSGTSPRPPRTGTNKQTDTPKPQLLLCARRVRGASRPGPAKASGERCDDAVLCGTPTHSRGRVPHAAAIEAACWCCACCHWCVAPVLGVTGLPLHPACVWLHGTSRDAADHVWAALTPAAWRAADARSGLRRLSWGGRVQCTHTRTHSYRPKLGNTCEPHSDSP